MTTKTVQKLSRLTQLVVLMSLSACSSFVNIDTPNKNDRVQSIVIHYTQENTENTLKLFNDPESNVSAHFVVTEEKIYQLIDFSQRAWHAGKSAWRGKTGLNDTSIGIELVYEVECIDSLTEDDSAQSVTCLYPDYPPALVDNLIKVFDRIYQIYPSIEPINVVAHQDIAPTRKNDPGPKFPWQYLNEKGYGAWYNSDDYLSEYSKLATQTINRDTFFRAIALYGYQQVTDSNQDELIKAFQTHFTPWLISGEVNQDSMAAILALLKKYEPDYYLDITSEMDGFMLFEPKQPY
ncbi:anhydro-N-acetylmuramyl-tripeptide amidase [Vibrio zhanjiangensis]|uniref:N-acetylmuramoyl-L-alanine amidase n=1 Tax=Vibrio zhanjiangensis TaxID=1046128 RepID=A0ABQ6EV93_9VIBR|nr:N-acetylmuramoyl-L-alanine amidase [Vibrio zhanjiangensis]GLT16591.1 anhydro-N-acetylmuramyl-tripeptide amidase [Vibrio zhanjiangensis]